MIEWTHPECESRLVIHALLREVLEDLLQRGLTHAIFCNPKLFPLAFDLAEQVANCLVFFRHSDLVEVAALLQELDLVELLRQELDEAEATLLGVEELDQTLQAHLILWIEVLFHRKIYSQSILIDLVQYHAVVVVCVALLDRFLQIDFIRQILASELQLLGELLKIFVLWLLDLDFYFVAHSVLVLNVLATSVAPEETTTDHDAHLGRKCLCLFHGMGGEDDCTLFVPLGDLLYNLPHEASGLRVHPS